MSHFNRLDDPARPGAAECLLEFTVSIPGHPSHGVAELPSSLRNPDPLGEEGGPAARNWARGHP